MVHNYLPEVTPITGDRLLPWKRLWCPLGGQIAMEGRGWDDFHRGFLAEPSKFANQGCRSLEDCLLGNSGVWALCGSPGSGKSGAIRLWLDSVITNEPDTFVLAVTPSFSAYNAQFLQLVQHRDFAESLAAGKKTMLVIDGFDQFQSEHGPPFASLAFALSQIPDRSNLRLIIGCRSRDWDHNSSGALRNLWPQELKQERVFEICPLTRRQVMEALAKRNNINPVAFLRELEESRLEGTAHWPFSLRGLLDSYEATGGLAEKPADRVSRTIDLMLRDDRASLRDRDSSQALHLRQCARRLAALLIFGGCAGVSRISPTAPGMLASDSFISTSEFAGEAAGTLSIPVGGEQLHQLCGTALMTAIRPPSVTERQPAMGFTHQSYAEFLAAEYVRGLEVDQLRGLFTTIVPGGERVPPQLVETASWLASMHPKWFEYLLAAMPEILLRSDDASYSDSQKQRLTDALLTRLTMWDAAILEEARLLTPSFAFPGLVDRLRPLIANEQSPAFSRRFAMKVVRRCRLAELEEELWQLLESKENPESCDWIIAALEGIFTARDQPATTIKRLKRALRGEMGPDDKDKLKGIALLVLVPKTLRPREIASDLTLPKDTSYFGAYWGFLERFLPGELSEDDVEDFLKIGAAKPSIFHVREGGRRLPRAVLKLFAQIEFPTEKMKTGFTGWVLRCAQNHTSLPLAEENDELEDVNQSPSLVADEQKGTS